MREPSLRLRPVRPVRRWRVQVCEAAGPGYTAIAPLLFRMPRYPCQSGIAGQFFFLLSRAPLVTMTFCRAALPTGTNMAVSAATMLVHTAHTVLLALAPGYRRSLSAHRAHVLAMRLLSCAAPATMSLLMPASLPRTFLVKRWLPSLPFLLAYQSMVGSLVGGAGRGGGVSVGRVEGACVCLRGGGGGEGGRGVRPQPALLAPAGSPFWMTGGGASVEWV